MPLGRPRVHVDEARRAEARRAKVRLNVQAFRKRQREKEESEKAENSQSSISSVISIPIRPQPGCHSSLTPTKKMAGTTGSEANIQKSTNTLLDEVIVASIESPDVQSLLLPWGLDAQTTYQDGFLATLQRYFLPEPPVPTGPQYSSGVRIAMCCSVWLSSAFTLSDIQGAEVLRSALLASALNVIGHESQDTRLLVSGYQAQTRALKKLRRAFDMFLANSTHGDAMVLATTGLVCAMSELIANKSWENYAKHMEGVSALIERSGPLILEQPLLGERIAIDLFYSYRAMQAPFCFMLRRASFLARSEWTNLTWRDSGIYPNDHMQKLLDVAYQIPGEMEDYDQSNSKSQDNLRARISRLKTLVLQLDRWKSDMDSHCATSPYLTKTAAWPGIYSESLEFSDLNVAMPFTKSCGFRIHLCDLIRTIAEDLSTNDETAQLIVRAALAEGLEWAVLACRCMEYFHSEIEKFKIIGKMIAFFPFDAAWDTFVKARDQYGMDMHRELSWCRQVADRCASMGLPVLRWQCKDLR